MGMKEEAPFGPLTTFTEDWNRDWRRVESRLLLLCSALLCSNMVEKPGRVGLSCVSFWGYTGESSFYLHALIIPPL